MDKCTTSSRPRNNLIWKSKQSLRNLKLNNSPTLSMEQHNFLWIENSKLHSWILSEKRVQSLQKLTEQNKAQSGLNVTILKPQRKQFDGDWWRIQWMILLERLKWKIFNNSFPESWIMNEMKICQVKIFRQRIFLLSLFSAFSLKPWFRR